MANDERSIVTACRLAAAQAGLSFDSDLLALMLRLRENVRNERKFIAEYVAALKRK